MSPQIVPTGKTNSMVRPPNVETFFEETLLSTDDPQDFPKICTAVRANVHPYRSRTGVSSAASVALLSRRTPRCWPVLGGRPVIRKRKGHPWRQRAEPRC